MIPTVDEPEESALHIDGGDLPTGLGGSRSRRRWTRALASLVIVAAWVGAGVLLVPHDPNAIDLARTSLEPGPGNLLGTDRLGRDVLSRLLAGGAWSVSIALAAAAISCGTGLGLGSVAGFGGKGGALVDRIVDVATSVPMLFVAIALQAALPQGVAAMVAVLALAGWPAVTRIIRAEVAVAALAQHVEAARALGCSHARVVWRHILPHCAGAATAAFTVGFGEALLLQSTLTFLGLGLPPSVVTWGGMLQEAAVELAGGAWWRVVLPGLAIVGTTALVGGLSRRLAAIGG